MREIKFRAWIGTQMEYRVIAGYLGNFWAVIDPQDSACAINTKYEAPTPVMQFIGLKDKNGKEIYEGDVVEWDVSARVTSQAVIAWDVEQQSITPFINSTTRVIGNIYENPELLQ